MAIAVNPPSINGSLLVQHTAVPSARIPHGSPPTEMSMNGPSGTKIRGQHLNVASGRIPHV